MRRPRPDFVMIRLADAGVRMAGEAGTLGWANARRHFHFKAGEAIEVERSYEWNVVLKHRLYQGEPMFEEVPDEGHEPLGGESAPVVAGEDEGAEAPKDGE